MLKNKKIFQIVLAVFSIFMLSGISSTQLVYDISNAASTKDIVQDGSDSVGGDKASNDANQVTIVIKNVIGILSFLVGLIAVLMIVIAGFRFVTSNGDAGTTKSARDTILYAVIGIIITVMAYAIVNFILDNITS